MIKKSGIFWASVLFVQILLFYIFSYIEQIVEWHKLFFEIQKEFHQLLFSWFSFSIGDIFYILLGVYLLFLFIQFLRGKNVKIQLLILLNAFYFVYQLFWGMLYFQKPLMEKIDDNEISIKELEILTYKYLELCKNSRDEVEEGKNGVFRIKDFSEIEKEIIQRQKELPLGLNRSTANIISFKPSLFSRVMSFTGILGYYNPFTMEAQYNNELPHTQLPFTLAHESAHQLGIAREQEANFVGYLLGEKSKNKDFKYSTHWFVLKSLLNYQRDKNPDFVEKIKNSFSQGMKRDDDYEQWFVKKYRGNLSLLFGKTNDWFLKLNQQEGSITYRYFINLLVFYERDKVKKAL